MRTILCANGLIQSCGYIEFGIGKCTCEISFENNANNFHSCLFISVAVFSARVAKKVVFICENFTSEIIEPNDLLMIHVFRYRNG